MRTRSSQRPGVSEREARLLRRQRFRQDLERRGSREPSRLEVDLAMFLSALEESWADDEDDDEEEEEEDFDRGFPPG